MSQNDLSGSTLGPFELRHIIGAGGMGTVYRAYQISLQRNVAVKVLSRNLTTENDPNIRFTAEAKIAASLEHPHIIPLYEYGTQNGISYIGMRLLTGGSLDTGASRYRSIQNITILLGQLAGALDYTHKQDVIHRDIKTANVLFDQFGVPYLTDFGIAKILTETSALTTTGRIIGTPSYMAPELWRNEPASAASDIYALGILVHTLLAGNPPFQATTPYALMRKHLYESPILPDSLPETAPEIKRVLSRALAKRADDRYETAGAFAQAFQEAVQNNQPAASAVKPAAKPNPTIIFTPQDSVSGLDHPTVTLTEEPRLNTAPHSKADVNRTRIGIGSMLILFLLIAAFFLAGSGVVGTTYNDPSNTPVLLSPSARAVVAIASLMTPTVRITYTSTPTQTSTPTIKPTLTPTASQTATATRTATVTPSPTASQTATATATPSPTATPTAFTGPVTPSSQSYKGDLTADRLTATQPFSWKAGEVVTICLSSQNFDSYLRLENASGEILTESDDYKGTKTACILNYTVPSTSTYTVVVSSYKRIETGSYQLEVTSMLHCALELPIGRVNQKNPINLRTRPLSASAAISVLLPNECFALIGRNSSSTWWKIHTADGHVGWVMNGLVEMIGETQSLLILEK